jgi:hypothetical protein
MTRKLLDSTNVVANEMKKTIHHLGDYCQLDRLALGGRC